MFLRFELVPCIGLAWLMKNSMLECMEIGSIASD